MFGVVHPLLLWGATAVAVPVLIHLLLRQRPRPRPWAAMRWLLAALQQAQRRYKLTNLLLLLLRCLAVLVAALAVARPSLAGLGQGGQLVVVLDCTASMGERAGDPGPLAGAKAQLAKAGLPARVVVVTVSDRVRVVADGGLDEARAALDRIAAEPIPGGLDRAAGAGDADALLAACPATADVLLVSDFQQDDADLLTGLLTPKVRSVTRWAVGEPVANAVVAGIDGLPDPQPGLPGELLLRLAGTTTGPAKLAVDGGPAVPAGDGLRVALPPLDAGDHRLVLDIADAGLAYDNRLELPLRVRGAVPTLIVHEHPDFLGASLIADDQHFEVPKGNVLRPAQLAQSGGLPERGLVALRARSGDGQRVATWVRSGGVLWAPLAVLRDEPGLDPLVAYIAAAGDDLDPLPYRSGDADLDDILATAKPSVRVPHVTLPQGAEVLLASGDAPVAVAVPAGRGWVVVELIDLAADQALAARGTTPLWVRRTARKLLARPMAPRLWEAGSETPEAVVLRRAGLVHRLAKGDPLLLPPGAWQSEDGPAVVVLPSRGEGQLDQRAPSAAVASLDDALPRRAGADWGMPLLIALLLVLLVESGLAAWAGRAYGR